MTSSLRDYCYNVFITARLSNVFATPGLRIGWIASKSEKKITELWSYIDYTSICSSIFGDRFGTIVLEPTMRDLIIKRTRRILRENWSVVEEWLRKNQDVFSCVPPEASAICLINYHHEINSIELADRLIKEKSVLIAPENHFMVPRHFRLGYGYAASKLLIGLKQITELLQR